MLCEVLCVHCNSLLQLKRLIPPRGKKAKDPNRKLTNEEKMVNKHMKSR